MLIRDIEDATGKDNFTSVEKRASVEILRSDLSSYRKLVDEFGISPG